MLHTVRDVLAHHSARTLFLVFGCATYRLTPWFFSFDTVPTVLETESVVANEQSRFISFGFVDFTRPLHLFLVFFFVFM